MLSDPKLPAYLWIFRIAGSPEEMIKRCLACSSDCKGRAWATVASAMGMVKVLDVAQEEIDLLASELQEEPILIIVTEGKHESAPSFGTAIEE